MSEKYDSSLTVVHRSRELEKQYNHNTSDLVSVLLEKKLKQHIKETQKQIDVLMQIVHEDVSVKKELADLLKEEKESIALYRRMAS